MCVVGRVREEAETNKQHKQTNQTGGRCDGVWQSKEDGKGGRERQGRER